jgi:site-specific recombinase XerC
MTPIASHITAFLRERLPLQRRASHHTCESYAYTFQWLFACASERLALTPSAVCLEHLDAQLVMDFLAHLETQRGTGPSTRTTRLAAIKSFLRFSSNIASRRASNKAAGCWRYPRRKPISRGSIPSRWPRCRRC